MPGALTSFEAQAFPEKHLLLWETRGAQPHLLGTQILQIPFSISLPQDTLPSGTYGKDIGPITISYMITLRAERKMPLGTSNITIKRKVIVPPDSTRGLTTNWERCADLRREVSTHVTRDPVDSKGVIHMHVNFPKQDRPFPMNTQIPFTVTVTTFSIPVTYTANSEAARDVDALSPSIKIANLHQLLRLKLFRQTTVRVAESGRSKDKTFECAVLGNLDERDNLDVDVGSREWVQYPSEPRLVGKGRWVQQFRFRSHFKLTSHFATPTINSESFSINVRLFCGFHLEIFVLMPYATVYT